MAINLSIEQIEERRNEFFDRFKHSGGFYKTLYLTEWKYHTLCTIIKNQGIPIDSPEVKSAERTYLEALLLEANGGNIKSVAGKIMSSHIKLQRYYSKCLNS